MTAKLHELGDARVILDSWLLEHEGELLPEIEVLLEDLDCAASEKVERVALYILELEANAAICKEEATRLSNRSKGFDSQADSLRGYLQTQLARLGKKSIQGTRVNVTRQLSSSPTIRCDDLAVLFLQEGRDAEQCASEGYPYLVDREEQPPKYHLNRAEIIRRWKAGEPLPESIVVEQNEHVRIR